MHSMGFRPINVIILIEGILFDQEYVLILFYYIIKLLDYKLAIQCQIKRVRGKLYGCYIYRSGN